MPRFKCVAETANLWAVWDEQKVEPATLGGKVLTGMPIYRAEVARDVLERINAAEGVFKRK